MRCTHLAPRITYYNYLDQESFMMLSTFSRVVPPPNPSQKSASPSSCRQPVTNNLLMMARIHATATGKNWAPIHNTPVMMPPVSHPASGHNGTTRLKCSAGTLVIRQKGSRVKKISAAHRRSYLRLFKTFHAIQHAES